MSIKKQKGMLLIEMIVALVVFSIAAAMLVSVMPQLNSSKGVSLSNASRIATEALQEAIATDAAAYSGAVVSLSSGASIAGTNGMSLDVAKDNSSSISLGSINNSSCAACVTKFTVTVTAGGESITETGYRINHAYSR